MAVPASETLERPAARAPGAPARAPADARVPGGGRSRTWPLVLGCVALAAVSLLLPAAPTYDPWAWIIWGREIAEGTLDTRRGPSWKPLPVLFTTPFSLAGDAAAPDLWLVIARAGALLALAAAWRLAARLAGPAAGAMAAVALLVSEDFVRHSIRGNSEGLLVGLVLLAVGRHLEGRRTQAFLLGFGAALLRPEVWPFWGLYGLWLMWPPARMRVRALVAGCAAAIPLLWFVPEWFGSGNLLRAAARAREPNLDSAAYAARPFLEVFERSIPLLAPPVWAGAALAVGLVLSARRNDRLVLGLAAVAASLMVAVGLMTEAGFAGNLRYVTLPASLVCVLAGAGWVIAVRRAEDWPATVTVLTGIALTALFAPALATALRDDMRSVAAEASYEGQIATAVQRAGGADPVNDCGAVFTGRFEVPVLAWHLHRRLEDIRIFPHPPGSVFANRRHPLARDPRFHPVAQTEDWVVGRNCPGLDPLAP